MEQAEYQRRLIESYEEEVSSPGKFEGEPRYVPHFYDHYMNGGADRYEDDGHILGFDITAEDKALFPELKRRRTVKLVETDSGFICEV